MDLSNYIKNKYNEHKQKKKEEEKKKQAEANKPAEPKISGYDSLSSEEKDKVKDLFEKKEREFERLANQELRKLLSEPEFKAKIRKKIDKGFEDGMLDPKDNRNLYNNDKLPRCHVKNYYSDYWEVIDDDQQVRIVCSDICSELAKRLEDITGYNIGTGDGDEGCIYPLELISSIDVFYTDVYKKEVKESVDFSSPFVRKSDLEIFEEQEILQEMHISKADLKDPKILNKVLEKSKKESNNATALAVSVPFLLGIAADVVAGIVAGSILTSIGLFIPFIFGAAILAMKLLEMIPNYEDKNIKKLVTKTEELKKNTMKMKESKEKKEILDRCDKILKSVEKHKIDKADKASKKQYEKDKKLVSYIIKLSKSEVPPFLGEVYDTYFLADKLGIAKPADLDKAIVNYCIKNKNEDTGYDNTLAKLFFGEFDIDKIKQEHPREDIDKLEKVVPGFKEHSKVYVFYAIDDTVFFFNYKNKTFYYGDYGADYLDYNTSLYRLASSKKNSPSEFSKEELERYKSIYEELKNNKKEK